MSNVSKREIPGGSEYLLPLPCYWDDLTKAIAWAERDLGPDAAGDAVQITVVDDVLVLTARCDA